MTNDNDLNKDLLYCNGINGATGEYFHPPLSLKDIAKVARGETFDAYHLAELERRKERDENQPMGPVEGVDPKNLAEAGWGVIFAYEYKDRSGLQAEQIREELKVLLDHRRQQATQTNEKFYQEYIGSRAYRSGESKLKFLERHRVGPGPADPQNMPYYLLIVGDPESIPYHFQYQLDVQYAVGRIYFDTLEKYTQYAQSVVRAETNPSNLPRRIHFFGVKNDGDRATQQSFTHLVKPLANETKVDQSDWLIQTSLCKDATKANLTQLLGGSETPALLFTGSHGICFPKDHPRQLADQGALICQDWPGPLKWQGDLDPQQHYFAATDVDDDAQLHGLIVFNYACYGSGTPKFDDFAHKTGNQRAEIAPHAFIAQLPQRLLSHPNGGALAVIGHVERAWNYSFQWGRAKEQTAVFQSTLQRLMAGHPIGSAVEFFNERYAELSSDLNFELEEIKHNVSVEDEKLAYLWTAHNDARNYMIIGDPAVKLCGVINNTLSGEQETSKVALGLSSEENSEPRSDNQRVNLKEDTPEDIQNLVTDLLKRVEKLEGKVNRLQVQNQSLQEQINHL